MREATMKRGFLAYAMFTPAFDGKDFVPAEKK